MSLHTRFSLVLIAFVAAVLACGTATPGPNDAGGRATGLAQTAAALLTSTAAASVTPVSPAPQPTNTVAAPPTATATATQPPPPPAATTAAPPPPEACAGVRDSDFVADVNVPDGTHFAGGAVFSKTWRLRNSGACTWTTSYQLRYISGEAMGGATVNLAAPVPPGATTDITVTFTAPAANGSYTSRWQLFDETGTAFGTKPYVQINVP
ncbi:MAG: hypothetical protein IT317_08445 [Anaerolineales bacterium]|nr:hypothetical protein [Anaerolineales bacterium]